MSKQGQLGPADWTDTVSRLIRGGPDLEGGAELVVHEQGEQVYRRPLSRMLRIEYPDPGPQGFEGITVWIRPIVGAYQDFPQGPWLFSLSQMRPPGIHVAGEDHIQVRRDTVTFNMSSGQVGTVGPIGDDLFVELDRWDRFFYNQLSAQTESDLDALAEDSWWGEFA